MGKGAKAVASDMGTDHNYLDPKDVHKGGHDPADDDKDLTEILHKDR